MKINAKLLYIALPILVFIFSCSKENNPVEKPVANQKLINVSLNVSGFTSDITPLRSLKTSAVNQTTTQAVANLSDYINKLEYLIYNSSGQLVKDSIQNSTGYFGPIDLQLPAGTYKLIVAGTRGFSTTFNKENSVSVYLTSYSFYGIGDWFKQVSDFEVTDQSLNQSVVLDRVVGKVGFVLTDAIPKDIAKISLVYTSLPAVNLNNSNGHSPAILTYETQLKPSYEGSLNFSSYAYVIPMDSGFITTDVSIRAYNTAGTLVVEKIIKNVVIEKNKMTTLSGALFTSLPSGTATNVTINSDWKPSTIVTF